MHLTKDPSVVAGLCNAMIGNKLITKQTPPEGIPVSKVGLCYCSSSLQLKTISIVI